MKLIVILALALYSLPSLAAEAPEKMTVEQVILINGALAQLNCAPKILHDGAKESSACEPFKLSAGLTWQIATNQRKTQEIVTQYNRVRQQAVASAPRKADGNLTDEAAAKLLADDRAALDVKLDIQIDHFKRADLEPLNLQPGIVSALLPIIDP